MRRLLGTSMGLVYQILWLQQVLQDHDTVQQEAIFGRSLQQGIRSKRQALGKRRRHQAVGSQYGPSGPLPLLPTRANLAAAAGVKCRSTALDLVSWTEQVISVSPDMTRPRG